MLLFLAIGCAPVSDETDAGLPDESDLPTRETGVSDFPDDTDADTGFVQEPIHVLTVRQWGMWSLSPEGGPYTTMVGVLRVQEYLDGARPADTGDTANDSGSTSDTDTSADTDTSDTDTSDTDVPDSSGDPVVLDCDVVYSLTGELSEGEYPDYVATFTVNTRVVSGDVGMCHDPDLPYDDENRHQAWDADSGWIVEDYGGIGVWLPWYPAEQIGDRVRFEWISTLGVAVEEEDP
jgi:hypothetical protein